MLFWASCRLAEIVAEGKLKVAVATRLLEGAARINGLWRDPEDGPERCRATIASGFHAVEQGLLEDAQEGRQGLVCGRWRSAHRSEHQQRRPRNGGANMSDDITNILSVFEAKCGHTWVGASSGSYACPICGMHDGDHHLVAVTEVATQVEDWGCAWEQLSALAEKRWRAGGEQ